MSSQPMVSVVIPARNERRHISACLRAVQAQDYPAALIEIIVADGMSDDGSREIITEHSGRDRRIRLIDNPAGIVPTGMNRAIAAAAGTVIVRVDGHCLIEPDYVTRVIETLQRTGADGVGGTMAPVAEGAFAGAVAMATSTPFGVGNSAFHYATREQESDSVYLGAYPRAVFSRFGGYDEELARNQDDELNYRIRAGGGRIILNPAIRSTYYPRATVSKLFSQYFQYGWWKTRVMQRVPSMISARHVAPSAFVICLAIMLLLIPVRPLAALLPVLALAAHALASVLFCAGKPSPVSGISRSRCLAWVPLATLAIHTAYGLGFLLSLPSLFGRGRVAAVRPIIS